MQEMTPEQMSMRLFHLTAISSAPMTRILGIQGQRAAIYLELLKDELPPGLRRDLTWLHAFSLGDNAEVAALDNLLTQGIDGVVSWALNEAWNFDPSEVENQFLSEFYVPTEDQVEVAAELAKTRFHGMLMESEEFKGEFDGWGQFQGEALYWGTYMSGHLEPLGRNTTITGPMIRERLRHRSPIHYREPLSDPILMRILDFFHRGNKIIPDSLYTTPDERDPFDTGSHEVFNTDSFSFLSEGDLLGLYHSMFRAQEHFTKDRILAFHALVEEYNFQWAAASFDWSGGQESAILERMRGYVEASPYGKCSRGVLAERRRGE